MTFAFDLISDLHVESWPEFNWEGQATAPYCIVAGDVARDRGRLLDALKHLGQCYPGGVFYIDGNEEHKDQLDDLGASYRDLYRDLRMIPNVVFIQDNVIIINGVAIVGTNAWWTYDFDQTNSVSPEETMQHIQDHFGITNTTATDILGVAFNDVAYLQNSVRKLQTHNEVREIIIVTHTVPGPWLVSHDVDLVDSWMFNTQGNIHLGRVLLEDTEKKIKTWCFGHYHKPIDRQYMGVRYVSNPHGRGNTPWCQQVYYPKRIEVSF
jgi:predicted phosphohydrolase